MRHLLLFPLAALSLGVACWACAKDPYLDATIQCVTVAPSRAAADACRAKLQPDAAPAKDASRE
jgi:hypothetical protein